MLAYNPQFVILIAILFSVLTAIAVKGVLEYRGRTRPSTSSVADKCFVPYFPKFCSTRAIIAYVVTLIIVSSVFINHAMPFQFMVFGLVSVLVFFIYSNKLTQSWERIMPKTFIKKLFVTALLIRLAYVVFIYFYYIQMTGIPHAYHSADEGMYDAMALIWSEDSLEELVQNLKEFVALSDTGYIWWLSIEYKILGTHVLPARLVKCLIDAFSCVLLYSLAERNFGEKAGRIAAVFYMLMPNTWFYCGVTLKEIEMAFMVMLFVERADLVLHSPKIKIQELFLPLLIILIMFTFRTALASVLFAALVAALILSSAKQLQAWKKVLYSAVFTIWMLLTVGAEIVQESRQLWEGRAENQEVGYQWRAERAGGNTFAKYATASVFAPLIFTIPFSSMVYIEYQENQMMMNGGNFIKNILSGFTILTLFILLLRGDWRKHVLPLAVTCGYLVVLVFSTFAHSERFHFPVLGLELMFAAYGVTQMTNQRKRWFVIWVIGICIANVLWAWIKLKGRGFI